MNDVFLQNIPRAEKTAFHCIFVTGKDRCNFLDRKIEIIKIYNHRPVVKRKFLHFLLYQVSFFLCLKGKTGNLGIHINDIGIVLALCVDGNDLLILLAPKHTALIVCDLVKPRRKCFRRAQFREF